MTEPITFRITVPHSDSDWHQWYFPGAWPGHPAAERRDRSGRRLREGADGQHWLILRCNNTECDGEAVVPVRLVTDHADASDPLIRGGKSGASDG